MGSQREAAQPQQQQPPVQPPPSVLLLPLPLQGPINCFLKLAHLLTLSSDHLNITFLNAEFVHQRLPDLPTRLPRVNFSLFSDGVPGDDPRPPEKFASMVSFFENEVIRCLPEFLKSPAPATCLVVDGVFPAVVERAKELGIPVVYFSTLSPCCIWANSFLVPKLFDSGEVPFKKGMDLNEPVSDIPGEEEISLRWCDLPGICRTHDTTDPYIQLVLKECRELPKAQGHILNTFDDLEEHLLAELRSLCPNLYTIGPIHLHSRTRLEPVTEQRVTSNSLWQEDRNCITWLDSQPSESVIFVSFGSVVPMTIDQLIEFQYGLVNSGVRFLWVRRPGSLVGIEDSSLQVPTEILEERGFIVEWAPQEEVLAHRAIGGFLTHSGWNSTLESIVEGVPMLCWPNGIDQLVISRFVGDVWKIGIDMKDKCDRVVIEDMVRDLMVRRRDEFSKRADRLSKSAAQAVREGGSSWQGLHRLIQDIKFMRLQVHSETVPK
ncbi:7-deoxyloganetic acid glucosyl transferase [Spinacia oleracea]|uniref:Glycosyltransferase n=1 Tax=Spinacia oleracea TaxID=3562 RepID=A0A9R0J290_SPIOL|nr:7-deoxyloganetic acid glucosyl transferase-like [Spinacia oleracea]XP_056687671.1 7-deoxyloganetic acid glucosyl transferase-like [Spinacia oleracea]